MNLDDTWMGTRPETGGLEGLVGRTIAGRYRIDAWIGEGGMGAVFAGFHLGMKRDIAIKVLLPTLTAHEEAAARFEREAQAASRLEHRNIVRVFDFGAFSHEGVELKYIVMERLEGQELAAMLGQPMPQGDAQRIALEIFEALAHAHARGVVHRDLKPENIFVSSQGEGTVKLVDFGIAKLLDGDTAEVKLTRLGAIFGTPQYMSPEQALGEEVDHRSDLYAAGLILYEMLAGAPPFRANEIVSLLRMQIQATPDPIPGLHPGLKQALEGLLAKDRATRSQSADEVLQALRSIDISERPSPHWPVTLYDRIEPWLEHLPWKHAQAGRAWARNHWKQVWAAAAGVSLVSAIVIWNMSGSSTQEPPPGVAENPPEQPLSLQALADALPMLGVPPARLEALRTLVLAGKSEVALKEADLLLEAYPGSAPVHWLKGDALSQLPNQREAMMAAYHRALELDPQLVEDRDVYARLGALLREPQITSAEIDLLLAGDAEAVRPLVIELLHRKEGILDYPLRHRILDAQADGLDVKIDLGLQVVLDLWQAGAQSKPCHVFAEALATMAAEPRSIYVASLEQVPTPSPVGGSSPCEGLEAKRKELAAKLRLAFPEASSWIPEGFTPRKATKRRKRRRPFSGLFR